jgi:hypothetical protein
MGLIKEHPPVKLISAITYCSGIDLVAVITELEKLLGTHVDARSGIFNFSKFTSYYEIEMGNQLRKCFITFTDLINPEKLPEIKVKTNELEEKYTVDKNRQVNIDPGYITQAKLVLVTTKNYSHRIYLGLGIFGDVHMQYSKKSYHPQPWTYPDYQNDKNVTFFNTVRQKYLEQLANI